MSTIKPKEVANDSEPVDDGTRDLRLHHPQNKSDMDVTYGNDNNEDENVPDGHDPEEEENDEDDEDDEDDEEEKNNGNGSDSSGDSIIETDPFDYDKSKQIKLIELDEKLKAKLDEGVDTLVEACPKGLDSIVQHFTFQIANIESMLAQPDTYLSEPVQIGGYRFNLMIVVRKGQDRILSAYLKGRPVDEKENEIWSFPVHFAFNVWDADDITCHKVNFSKFRFSQRVDDWGFVKFLDSKFPTDEKFFRKNKVNITVYVRVIDDYTNCLYSNYVDYDSKKSTGFVGIENQGATCYLNSLLQSYYFTKVFRKKVYKIPTDDEIKLEMDSYEDYKHQHKTVSLALQRIFYRLQTSNVAINSLELTHSFGWTTADAFTQHDVQELNRILMDRLETKMKGTEIDGCLNDIFVGKMKSFIRCVNVDYESSRTEDFWDIQLNVKGLKDIKESFDNYVELELLDGENKYDASGFGLQDAEKGVIFESFPDVLHIQLKRYEYDFETDNMVKIHDRYEFFDEIDLKPYLDKTSPGYEDENWNYKLHCVLVHQGDVSGGHYYAMIKPTEKDEWYKFDDDIVTRVTPYTVFEDGFGCGPPKNIDRSMTREEYQNYIIKHHTSAYMLVYFRESKIPHVLADVEEADVPEHVKQQIKYENQEDAKIKKEREEMHLYINFKIFTDETFAKYQGFDLGPDEDNLQHFNEDLFDDGSFPIKLKLLKTQAWESIYETICKFSNKDPKVFANKLRLWSISKRSNNTYRPERPIESMVSDIDNQTIESIALLLENGTSRRKYAGSNVPVVLSLYLEDACRDLKYLASQCGGIPKGLQDYEERLESLVIVANKKCDASLEPIGDDSNILIMVKLFDQRKQTLKGVSHIVLPSDAKIDFIAKFLQLVFNVDDGEQISFIEEISFSQRVRVRTDLSLYQNEISSGDIVCASFDDDQDKELQFQDAESYYAFLETRVHFYISPLKRIDEDEEDFVFVETDPSKVAASDSIIDIWISSNSSYLDICTFIGKEVGISPEYIKLSVLSNGNKTDLKSDFNFSTALQGFTKNSALKLYYETLNIPLKSFESMQLYRIYWVGNGICKEEKHDFYLPSASTLEDVVSKLQSKLKSEIDLNAVFCWVPDRQHKIKRIVKLEDSIDNHDVLIVGLFPQYKELFFNDSRDVILIAGFQCYSSIENTHGLPFVFDLVKGEKLPETYVRLHKLLGLSGKEFNSARIGITNSSVVEFIDKNNPASNSIELFNYFENGKYMLVIDHLDRKGRRSSHHSSIMIR